MKSKDIVRKVLCLLLVVQMMALSSCSSQPDTSAQTSANASSASENQTVSYQDYNGVLKKSETVYVTLDAKGSPAKTLVSDWLHTDQANVRVEDQSDLTDIQNVKGDIGPQQKGQRLTWEVPGTDLYYQGLSDKRLPVEVEIAYYLDGQSIQPQDLAGKSGKVKIEISLKNTQSHLVDVDGQSATMYTPILAVGGMILPEETFQNIQIENGTLLGDGAKQAAVFVSLPGLEESLGLSDIDLPGMDSLSFPDHITVTADCTDFELGNMMMAMTTQIPQLDTLKASQSLEDIKQNLSTLQDIQNSVTQMDPDQVLRTLFTDPEQLEGLKTLTGDLSTFHELDTTLLDLLPRFVNTQNINLVERLRKDVSASKLNELLDSPIAANVSGHLDSQSLQNAKRLLDDVAELQNIDMDPLNKILGSLGDAGQLMALLQSSGALADQISSHPDALPTLQRLLGYSDDVMDLADQVNALTSSLAQQGITLGEEEIHTMVSALVNQKALEKLSAATGIESEKLEAILSASPADMIGEDGIVPASYRESVVLCIGMAAANNSQVAALKQILVQQVQSGTVSSSFVPVVKQIVSTVQNDLNKQLSQADQMTQQVTAQVLSLMQEARSLEAGIEDIGIQNIQDSIQFVETIMPSLSDLTSLLEQNKDQITSLQQVFGDPQTMQYLQETSAKLLAMKQDLDANAENLQFISSLLEHSNDPSLQAFVKMLPTLQKDLKDASPILQSLSEEMDNAHTRTSLQNSPETIATLLKMKVDLESNRQITDALSSISSPDTLDTASDTFSKLDEMMEKNDLGQYVDVADTTDLLLKKVSVYADLGQDNSIFTTAPEGAQTDVKFIFKTAEIKKPKQEETTESQEKTDSGIGSWFQNLFRKDN
nr:hypothetical protein [uncultured Solibaculum sp.]